MSPPHATTGEIVDVRPPGDALATAGTRTPVKTTAPDVIRVVLPVGREIPTHTARGELVDHCLEGKLAFTACGRTHDLVAGRLRLPTRGEPDSLRGIEDGSLLQTVVLPGR